MSITVHDLTDYPHQSSLSMQVKRRWVTVVTIPSHDCDLWTLKNTPASQASSDFDYVVNSRLYRLGHSIFNLTRSTCTIYYYFIDTWDPTVEKDSSTFVTSFGPQMNPTMSCMFWYRNRNPKTEICLSKVACVQKCARRGSACEANRAWGPAAPQTPTPVSRPKPLNTTDLSNPGLLPATKSAKFSVKIVAVQSLIARFASSVHLTARLILVWRAADFDWQNNRTASNDPIKR